MEGLIIKAISGFYYVDTGSEVYECKAKGSFKIKKISPLVGDKVKIDVLDKDKLKGNIAEIKPRTNLLYRPKLANVSQVIIVFSLTFPKPNLALLDKFLILMEKQNIKTIIAISKCDLKNETDESFYDLFVGTYRDIGYKVIAFSSFLKEGISDIKSLLKNQSTCLAGPSGVGKSTLINVLQDNVVQTTGEISKKLGKGKNTTRHTRLIKISESDYIIDTPGFTSLELMDIKPSEVRDYFPEFANGSIEPCKYIGCTHIKEPECGVKKALEEGKISVNRYNSYVSIYNDLKSKERF